MTKPSKKDLEQIRTALEDNAADITVHELFDRVIMIGNLQIYFPMITPNKATKIY